MSKLRKLLLVILALLAAIEVAASEAGCRECELEAGLADLKDKLSSCEEALKEKANSAGKDSYLSQGRSDSLYNSRITILLYEKSFRQPLAFNRNLLFLHCLKLL